MSTPENLPSPLERGTHEDAALGAVERTFTPPTIVTSQANQRAAIFESIDVGAIIGELSDTSKQWWKSRTILAVLAALIMLGLEKFGALPAWLTEDNLLEFLLVAVPLVAAIVARFGAKDQLRVGKPPALEGNENGNP